MKIRLSQEFLLRKMLEWYSSPSSWDDNYKISPYSNQKISKALCDKGAFAKRVLQAKDIMSLLMVVFDAYNIPYNKLVQRTGLTHSMLEHIILDGGPKEKELIEKALSEILP